MKLGQALTGWRKIANAAWDGPNDPQIYGALEIEASAIVAYLKTTRAAGHHVTPTHLVGRAVALALEQVPDLNVRLAAGRAFPRPSVDVFFITAIDGGHDLSGVKIVDVPAKSAPDIAKELGDRGRALKGGRDPDLARSKRAMEVLPLPILRAGLRLVSWVTNDLGLSVPPLGLAASPFGSAMISSVGMLGIPTGFSPLARIYGVPLLVLVGELAPKPVAIDNRVEVRPVLPITATIDHRYADGWHLARAMHAVKSYLASPRAYEPVVGADASLADAAE